MNKKKLIGTLIGIILFGALIAGATFAWLTFNASVNGSINVTTKNFKFNYTSGAQITCVPILISTTTKATPATSEPALNADATQLAADCTNGKAIRRTVNVTNNGTTGGQIWIILKHDTSENIIVNSSPTQSWLKYAFVTGTAPASDFTGTNVLSGRDTTGVPGVFASRASNTNPAGGNFTDQILHTEHLAVGESKTFYIYFWLDAERVNTAGLQYSGHIYAYGIQDES